MAGEICGQRKHTNKSLLPVLKQIYATEVALEDSENQWILEEFLENFREKTSHFDNLFSSLFDYFYPTGSSYEGLRVKEATEFDINVVFFLPFPLKVVEVRGLPFVTVQLSQPLPSLLHSCPHLEKFACLHDIFNEEGYLIGRKVLSWFQCLVDHFVENEKSSLPSRVKNSSGGPARTLNFNFGGHWFSVDLVPVFRLDGNRHIRRADQLSGIINLQHFLECHIVPKPLKEPGTLFLSETDSFRLWRVHFPTAEKQILRRKNVLKPVIKLLKCLKEKEDWPIPSYFIKTIGMLLVKKNPDPEYWEQSKMDIRFLEGLECLFKATAKRKLLHVFYPEFNLFHATPSRVLLDISNRIGKILKLLYQDPRSARKFFRCPRYLTKKI